MTQIRFKVGEQKEGEPIGPVKHGAFGDRLSFKEANRINGPLYLVTAEFQKKASRILLEPWELKTPEDFALEILGFLKGSMNGPEALTSAWKLVSTALVKPGIVLEAARFLLDADADPTAADTFPHTGARGVSISTPVERYHIRSTFSSTENEDRVFKRARRDFFGSEDAQ